MNEDLYGNGITKDIIKDILNKEEIYEKMKNENFLLQCT